LIKLKSIIYKIGINYLRMFWRVRGGRTIKAFDEKYYVTADTIFPDYRKFRLPKKGCLSEIVRYTDYVQLHSLVNFVNQLKDNTTIIDVGAHHGSHSIILGKIIQKNGGRVIAVEPNPISYNILKRNIRLNKLEDTVICENVAIADKKGEMNIELIGSQSKLIFNNDKHTCMVDVITLEQLLTKYKINNIDLMIIDVEGAEFLVLRGFPWASVGVEKIFCELHPYAWKEFHYDGKDFRKFLSGKKYRCFDMYLNEHITFDSKAYIGPTLFVH
jgi:FkbM family methyltransferase